MYISLPIKNINFLTEIYYETKKYKNEKYAIIL